MGNVQGAGGTTTSFSNTPQAKDDSFSLSEDFLGIVYFDVMANDLGGNAKTLFSIDNGTNQSGAMSGYSAADLLTQDTARAEATSGDTSSLGAKIWITSDGTVGYDSSSLSAAVKAQIQALHAGQTLNDTFIYAIRLGNGTLSWATVTATFVGAEDNASISIVANGDYSVTEAGGIGNNQTNDPSAHGQLTVSDVDAGDNKFQIPAASALNGTYGTWTFNNLTGEWTYTLDNGRAATQALNAGDVVTETLTVKSWDGSATQPITVQITGSNDNASITAAPNADTHVVEAGGVANGTANDAYAHGQLLVSDVDDGEAHFKTPAQASLTGTYGTFTFNPQTGEWSYTLANGQANVEALNDGVTVYDTLTVTSLDGTASETIKVTIVGSNDNATITASNAEDTTVIEAGGVANATTGDPTAGGQLTVHDVDTGQNHFLAPASLTGTYGTFTFNTTTGVWGYTLTNTQTNVEALSAGQIVHDFLTVTSADGTASQTIDVKITGTNDAPVVAAGDVSGAVTEAGAPAGNLTDSGTIAFSDVDLSDVHSVGTVTPSAGALGTLTAGVTTDTTGSGTGGVVTWNYSVAASAVEYLAAGETKTETFSFTLSDGHGGDITRTVSVDITGTNDAPVVAAGDVSGAVTEAGIPAGNLTDSGTIAFSDVDLSDVHSVGTVTPSAGALGTLTAGVTTDTTGSGTGGVVTWNYSVAASAVEYLAAGETKTETFSFTLSDGHGGDITRTVSVDITGTNDAPVVAAGDVSGAVTEAGAPAGNLTDSGTIAFSDVDLSDVHSVGTVTPSAGALGTLTAGVTTDTTGSGTGGVVTWNYSVAASAVEYLAAGETKTETFSFTLSDGHGGDITRTVSVDITGTNDAPVVAAGDVSGAVTEAGIPAGNLTDSGTIAFSDVDLSDVHSVGTVTPSAGALGTLTAGVTTDTTGSGTGGVVTWNYSVAASAVEYLAAGETKTETFSFTLSDGHGGDITRTVSVDITGTNDAPVVAAGDVSGAVTEAGIPAGNLTDSGTIAFSDVDLSDVHSVGTVTPSAGALGTLTASVTTDTTGSGTGGVVTWNYSVAASAVEYLAAGETKTETFSFTLSDGHGGDITRTVSVDITGTNDAPVVAAGDVSGAVTEAGIPAGNLTDSGTIAFSDVDLSDVHSVGTVTPSAGALGTLTAGVTTDTTGSGTGGVVTWNYSVAASAVEYLAAGETKTETFSFTLSDGHGGDITRTVSVDITGTNDAPVVAAGDVSGAVTEAGAPAGNLTDSGTIAFSDVDLSDVHSVGTVTPSAGALGTLTAGVTTDTTGSGTGGVVTWNYSVAASAVEYLAAGETKTETFSFTLSDGHGGDITRTVSVDITGTNDAPDIRLVTTDTGSATLTETNAGLTASGTLTVNDPDLTNTVSSLVTAVAVTGPTGTLTNADLKAMLSLVPASGLAADPADLHNLTWNFNSAGQAFNYLASGQSLVLNYTVQSTDNAGASDTQTVTVTINGTNDAAAITGAATGAITEDAVPNTTTGDLNSTDVDGTNDLWTVSSGSTAHGSYSITAAGVWTYTLNNGDSQVNALNNGGTLPDSFVVTTADGTQQTVNITINGHSDTKTAQFGQAVVSGNKTTVVITFSQAVNTASLSATDFSFSVNPSPPTIQTSSFSAGNTVWTVEFDNYNGNNNQSGTLTLNGAGYTFADGSAGISATYSSFPMYPAGVSGSPINLALIHPADASVIAVKIANVPSGWTIAGGTLNADGTWSVETTDVGALTVTTPGDYTGAEVLEVSMQWTQADGSIATMVVSDNVEAFAPGNPIFAVSGDDNLTGSAGADLFVIAQPIGTDRLFSFDTSLDKVDLIGFAGFASFADVAAHLTTDASGNAVLDLGNGQAIVFEGVDASSLGAGNFVFDETPVLHNLGDMVIGDGAQLPLSGIIDNSGTILLEANGRDTRLELIQHGVTLQGGGHVVLSDNPGNVIAGTLASVALHNADNTISGAGRIGEGSLVLTNAGTITADGTNALVIDTGTSTVVNSGTLSATGAGGLVIASNVENSGVVSATGTITLNGALTGTGELWLQGHSAVSLAGAVTNAITLSADASATLTFGDAAHVSGLISGFDGNDEIDFSNLVFDAGSAVVYEANAENNGGILHVSNGAETFALDIAGAYDAAQFHVRADTDGSLMLLYGNQANFA